MSAYESLLSFLAKLEAQRIQYTLQHNRDEAVMVLVAVPGQRWEIEFMLDGLIDIEVFYSDGKILHDPHDPHELDELLRREAE